MDRNNEERQPKYTVLQFGVGWAWEQLKYSAPAWQAMCKKWGLEYRQQTTRQIEQTGRTPHWEKVFLINQWLREAEPQDVLLWADADTLPVRFDVDPRTILSNDAHVTLIKTKFGNWNNGLMFIRSENLSAHFWDAVWQFGPVPKWGTRWNDEARMNAELPFWEVKGFKIQELPPEWNDFDRIPVRAENPIVKAWHGTPRDTTLRRMKEEFDKIQWPS
jgi:hypothetical protein